MKIAIVGAGINGLYLAWKLSNLGHKVTVFERKQEIGKIACSGFFSERLFEFIPESESLVHNKIDYVLINFPGKKIKVKPGRQFYLINHAKLDQLVANLARGAGAEIILGKEVKGIPEDFDRVIGCDGFNSVIRKELSLPKPSFRITVQGFVKKEDYSNFVETWATDKGFIWKIPHGNEIEYGTIGSPKMAVNLFNEFIKEKGIRLESTISSVVPQGLVIPENKEVTLCGDAAGLTKPWSGGGVIWGLIAADMLLKNFPDFLKYKNSVKKFFLPRITVSKLGTRAAYFFGFNLPWLVPGKVRIEGDFLF